MVHYSIERCFSVTPARVWQALITPGEVARYYLVSPQEMDLCIGGRLAYGTSEMTLIEGRVLAIEPERLLSHSFRFVPVEMGTADDPESEVIYQLTPFGSGTRLLLTHRGFPGENQTFANISGGWPVILDQLGEFLDAAMV